MVNKMNGENTTSYIESIKNDLGALNQLELDLLSQLNLVREYKSSIEEDTSNLVNNKVSNILTPDTIPDAFSFIDSTDVDLSVLVESNEITVAGISKETTLPISVIGGEYSKNGGVWTTSDGTVVLGDKIKVRLTSSSVFSVKETATLDIGGVDEDFEVTTIGADISQDSFT